MRSTLRSRSARRRKRPRLRSPTPSTSTRRRSSNPAKIDAIERETRHDVIAFLTNLANHVGPEARFIHQGLTSSDVLDTCLAVQLDRAGALLAEGVNAVAAALKRRALEHKLTLCVGRSHGVHAEPTSFGLKLAGHYAEFARAAERLKAARREVATCAISGPVGTFASVDPASRGVCRDSRWGSRRSRSRPRSSRATATPCIFAVLGVIAGAIERLAVEIRHLQRSEVGEAAEAFGKGQKGSSAMPHKKNPILTENLTGLARVVRASVTPALENIALWHERDISHSAVERVFAPDATIALDFALARLAGVVDGLVVDEAAMRRNLESRGGLVYSQRVLLALIEHGMSREEAYALVQEIALGVWEEGGDFQDALGSDARVAAVLDRDALAALFAPAPYLKHVDTDFRPRVRARNERIIRQWREWTVMIEMQDHIAVITGAGSGFGEATALRLAREGMPIFCQDINEENAQRTAAKVREGNGRAEAIGGDVSNEADVKAMFAACREAFGDCTLLFANAGYARLSPFVEMSVEEFDRMVAVLLRGVFLCDREALGPMLEKGEGVIINTASQLGYKGAIEMAHYAAAKAGVIGLTKSLALEVSNRGVRINAVAPGPCNTPILDDISDEWKQRKAAELPLGRFGEAWEIAETVAFLAGPGGAIYVGQTLGPNSGDVML